ncbi:hypothetical protein B0G52_1205 [Cohnella sp. SGD-V74]|nr:hypothetical protein B0G52_1205 [Cohnella sp. SGD-V74]
MQPPRKADVAEFSFHARNFCEGVPGVRQAKVTQQGMIDASERVCIHALVEHSRSKMRLRSKPMQSYSPTRLRTVAATLTSHSMFQPDTARLQLLYQLIRCSNPTPHGCSYSTSSFDAPTRLSAVAATLPPHSMLQPDSARLQLLYRPFRRSNPTPHGCSYSTGPFAAPTRLRTVAATLPALSPLQPDSARLQLL